MTKQTTFFGRGGGVGNIWGWAIPECRGIRESSRKTSLDFEDDDTSDQTSKATCIVDPDPAIRNMAVPHTVARVHESMYSRPGRSRAGVGCPHPRRGSEWGCCQ
ncbi:hypothetical protein PoB_004533200 [Plakobranchus ocellatus]|uniref:Uncharacterized protein n=1 Tax=Plakobranchus ocellatus TaxID=259542 RepID=A0AAV4BIR8_9GAST|nr:hypothetical protein PoB_004533200 [Plakobranchus ocellatus]